MWKRTNENKYCWRYLIISFATVLFNTPAFTVEFESIEPIQPEKECTWCEPYQWQYVMQGASKPQFDLKGRLVRDSVFREGSNKSSPNRYVEISYQWNDAGKLIRRVENDGYFGRRKITQFDYSNTGCFTGIQTGLCSIADSTCSLTPVRLTIPNGSCGFDAEFPLLEMMVRESFLVRLRPCSSETPHVFYRYSMKSFSFEEIRQGPSTATMRVDTFPLSGTICHTMYSNEKPVREEFYALYYTNSDGLPVSINQYYYNEKGMVSAIFSIDKYANKNLVRVYVYDRDNMLRSLQTYYLRRPATYSSIDLHTKVMNNRDVTGVTAEDYVPWPTVKVSPDAELVIRVATRTYNNRTDSIRIWLSHGEYPDMVISDVDAIAAKKLSLIKCDTTQDTNLICRTDGFCVHTITHYYKFDTSAEGCYWLMHNNTCMRITVENSSSAVHRTVASGTGKSGSNISAKVEGRNIMIALKKQLTTAAGVEILNASGQCLRRHIFLSETNASTVQRIPFTSRMPSSGIYFVRLNGGDGVHTTRVVVP